MGVERRDRLMEVRRRRRQFGEELFGSAVVIEMDCDDLGGNRGSEVLHLIDLEATSIWCNEVVPFALDEKWVTFNLDPTKLSHARGPDPSG